MIRIIVTTIALTIASQAVAEEGFEEFAHTTVDFNRTYVLPRGTLVCNDTEWPDKRDRFSRGCHELERPLAIKVVSVFHGISEPQFVYHPVKGNGVGYVTRDAFPR